MTPRHSPLWLEEAIYEAYWQFEEATYQREHSADTTMKYIYKQVIPYIGNKRKLLTLIKKAFHGVVGVEDGAFVDFFAGSGVVGRYAKWMGYPVISNDLEPYAFHINSCYIGRNQPPALEALGGPERAFEALNGLSPVQDYISTYLCPADDDNIDHDRERLFYTQANGRRIDAIRCGLQRWLEEGWITESELSYFLGPLLYAAAHKANTSGVFKGFHRGWGGATKTAIDKITSPLRISMPVLYDNGQENTACRMDATDLAARLRKEGRKIAIAYLDPPYNQHPYGSNYHVLNTVALWDRPELTRYIEGQNKAGIRRDWRTERPSAYNKKGQALRAYQELLEAVEARLILTSYSTDGTIDLKDMLLAAAARGELSCVLQPYKRYRVSPTRQSKEAENVEFILVIDTSLPQDASKAERVYEEIQRAIADLTRDGQMTLEV